MQSAQSNPGDSPKFSYQFADFLLDAAEQVLLRQGEPVPLTPKAFLTLLYLVERAGHTVEKEELLREVWQGAFVEEGNLTVTIFMLRRALGEEKGGQKFIQTVPRRGYRFVAPVQKMPASDRPRDTSTGRGARRAGDDAATVNVAILPLLNASDDPSAEYLSDGITESIINSLSQLPGLRVLARSTVFRYKGLDVDPLAIGREMNVRAVLTGRLILLGDSLIIRVELVDTKTGWQLWGEQYNRKLSDIFSVQEEISRKISEELRMKLSGEEEERLAKRHTTSNEAYQTYLKGRYHWNKRTKEGIEKGIEYFKEAIALDPNYALAYAGLADSYALLGAVEYAALSPGEAMQKAREATLKALELDDTLAEAHASLAYVMIFDRNWSEAGSEYRRSIELNPSYATAHHWYAHYLTAMGRQTEAVIEIRRARELDPLSLPINAGMGWHYYLTRQFDEAIREYQKTLELNENFYMAHFLLGMAYEQVGRYEEALASYERAIALSGSSPAMLAAPGHAYAMLGRTDDARRVLSELHALSAHQFVSPYHVAVIHAALGETDEAFDWLNRACDVQSEALIWLAVDPMLDSLRSDPRFNSLMARIGLDF
ncbi:MAG TPA: tetratricopeptide repeat protein [Pyrinomonadaceae bacterium]|nr:tetratricopeptide repeat protein [Pyrinomonadaceae bacterium]